MRGNICDANLDAFVLWCIWNPQLAADQPFARQVFDAYANDTGPDPTDPLWQIVDAGSEAAS